METVQVVGIVVMIVIALVILLLVIQGQRSIHRQERNQNKPDKE